jgi:hypothetical protein|tara:strand:- start:116 stop:226 length:111 start_codon:yes stop_codon:yes gene_type:complete
VLEHFAVDIEAACFFVALLFDSKMILLKTGGSAVLE